jgi:hypothetical protein
MLLEKLAHDDDPEVYELMEWLKANPDASPGSIPKGLKPWMSVLKTNGYLKETGTQINCHGLSDLGQIALLKHQRKAHAEAQQTVEMKAPACEHSQPPCDEDGDKDSVDMAARKIREALKRKPELRTAKCSSVIKEAQVRKQDGLAALRQLRETGEYTGGGRKRDD